MVSTTNISGMLSRIADATPIDTFAAAAPIEVQHHGHIAKQTQRLNTHHHAVTAALALKHVIEQLQRYPRPLIIPNAGGRCTKVCTHTAVTIVHRTGRSSGERRFSALPQHKQEEEILERASPFCHTIGAVMSPNGLNAPAALAATTILMQDSTTKREAATPPRSTPRT